ncbi:MAG: hypothetical protein OXJ37_23040 [Bryobacterales bacterium]|nr:hypothetical protein [Bryobacterales bacterium]MDE0265295.1 hypothetical protein [Bryobacterales bacterium]
MRALCVATLGCALLCLGDAAFGQAEFRVYEEHPRLFLEPSRLQRLRNDVDRQSLRWRSLSDLVAAETAFEEQPLVDALRFQVEGAETAGRAAVAWSKRLSENGIGNAGELRQAALVYDWCYDLFDPSERAELREAMATAVSSLLPQAALGVGLIRSAILASIAAAGDWDESEAALAALLGEHWRTEVMPSLRDGSIGDDGQNLIAALETGLVVRHNLESDPLQPGIDALRSLARCRLLSYYPLDIETDSGRLRWPSRYGTNEQLARRQAPLYRIAEMLLVAYESNLPEFQFLQGWIRDEGYQQTSQLVAPYEFLWVNPYLPGLTAQSSPLLAHDPIRGRIFGRSGWDLPATWLGYSEGRLELLASGELSTTTNFRGLAPIYFPEAVVVPVTPPAKTTLSWEPSREQAPENAYIFLVGLRAGDTYGLKIGGRDARLVQASEGGIIVLQSAPLANKRDRIDLRRKVRLELRPTLKPTDPRRPPPTLRQ